MDRPDYELEQKEQMLKGISLYFELYGGSEVNDLSYTLVAQCFWDSDSFMIPSNYHLFREERELPLKNNFEGKYYIAKAVVSVMSGERIPNGYGLILRMYNALFSSILFRHQTIQENIAVAMKYVISPLFIQDKRLLDYIYQDFDGLGTGITKLDMVRIHPLWAYHMFYEEIIFEGELESLVSKSLNA